MAPKKRLVILVVFAVLFGVCALILVAYSRGWRIDSKRLRLVQTGAIYAVVTPNDSEIILNGKKQTRPRISFQNGRLIDKLDPKTYELEVSRENRQTWYQQVAVRSGMVSAFRNIVLFPPAASGRETDRVYRDQIIFGERHAIYLHPTENRGIELKIRNSQNNESVSFILEKLTDLRLLQASANQKFFLLKQGGSSPRWVTFNANTSKTVDLGKFFKQPDFESAQFNPQKDEELFIKADGKIQILNLVTQKTRTFWPKPAKGLAVSNDGAFLVDAASNSLIFLSLDAKTRQTIAELERYIRSSGSNFSIKPINADRFLLWSENDNLLFVNRSNRNLPVQVVDSNILEAVIDQEGGKAAYVKKAKTGFELWVFYLENDESSGQTVKSGEKVFLISGAGGLNTLSWLRNKNLFTHLLAVGDSELQAIDIDARGKINSAVLAVPVKEYHYNNETKLLQWTDGETLRQTVLDF